MNPDIKRQLTKQEAIEFHDSKDWERWTDSQIAYFQIHQEFLAIPFGKFQESVEKAVGHPVFTHEFAKPDHLIKELDALKTAA